MAYLWEFSFNNNDKRTYTSAPPKLIPANSKTSNTESPNFLKNSFSSPYKVDVVNDFYWTIQNPRTQEGQLYRNEVPRIELIEKRINTNAIVNQAFYSTATGVSKIGDVSKEVAGFTSSALGSVQARGGLGSNVAGSLINAGGSVSNFFSTIGGSLQALGAAGSPIGNAVSLLQSGVQKISNKVGLGSLDGVLAPYDGLYFTEPTGWNYNIPYFENLNNNVNNVFGDLAGMFGGAVAGAREAIGEYSQIFNLTKPGTYIERTKMFKFEEEGDEFTFEFPLINTSNATFDDVIKNWQLLFLLIYQNRPSRTSRDIIDFPVIYEVLIPGVKYTPFAYIQNLTIEFLGSRRSMIIPVPQLTNSGRKLSVTDGFETIIPDAYKVSITLKSLVAETRNFLYAMLYQKRLLVQSSTVNTSAAQQINSLSRTTQNILDINRAGGNRVLTQSLNIPTSILPGLT